MPKKQKVQQQNQGVRKPDKTIDVPEPVREMLTPRFTESNRKGNEILQKTTHKRKLEQEIEQLFREREALAKEVTDRIRAFMDTLGEETERRTIVYNPDTGQIEIYEVSS